MPLMGVLGCRDLVLPRELYSACAVGVANHQGHPVGPWGGRTTALRKVTHVLKAIGMPLREVAQQRVVHHPILGRGADRLCQGRSVEFAVEVTERAGRSVVAAAGELDAHAAPLLQAEVGPLSSVPGGALVIDLAEVSFIDSTGLGVLVQALKHTREAQGRLDVVVASPRVLKVLGLTGLDVVIPLHATLDEALQA